MDRKYTVYQFTFPNGKLYFGITSAIRPEIRWGHGKNYNNLIRRAIDKYGWDNVSKEILADQLSEDQAKSMEIELIARYDTTNPDNGYNLSKGGNSCCGYVVSDETRAKLSDYAKHKRSPEHIKRISEALKGRQFTADHRKKISEGRRGKLHTAEAKSKISYASAHRSEQAKENHRNSLIGRPVSEATRVKISEAQKGVPKPDWLKEKFRQAALHRSPETLEKQARSRSKPIVCATSHTLYKTTKAAALGESVSEERVLYSCKNNVLVKGKQFMQYPIGTNIDTILADNPHLSLSIQT